MKTKYSLKLFFVIILLLGLESNYLARPQVFAQTINPTASSSGAATDSTTPPTSSPTLASSSAQPTPTPTSGQVQGAATSQNPFLDNNATSLISPASQQTLSNLLASSFVSSQLPGSAIIQQPPVVQKLLKHSFKMDESIQLTVSNATADKVKAWLTDWRGQTVNTVLIDKQTVNTQTAITVDPPAVGFKPGKYTLHVTDPEGKTTTQDFTWGVLAINTDKSVYTPNEIANIAMAVLDEKGAVVCDAKVQLQITNPQSGATETLSTDNGKITITPQCNSHAFSLTPDYEATYQVAEAGQYDMTLTATTKNGTYSINDSTQVADSVPFDVERSTATRIYPRNGYPVIFHITANQDFTGTVTDYTPANFDISPYATGSAQTYTSSSLQMPPVNTEQEFGAASISLSKPFSNSYPLEQGFGAKMTDPEEAPYYASFGLAGHDGLDFGLPSGTPVLAADDGIVSLAGDGAYGITVVIDHSWGKSYYGHLSKVLVKVGDKVTRGFEIGLSGATGHVTGPHLHFGIKPKNPDMANGYYGKVDPMPYFTSSPALLASDTSNEQSNNNSNDSQVLGISTTTIGQTAMKVIKWNISIKKGDTIDLAYLYHAPNVSPQFYTLGPLTFTDSHGTTQFQEQRQWQIAVDAAPTSAFTDGSSTAIGTSATTLVSQATSFANSNNLIIAPCLFNTTNTTTHTIAAGNLILQNGSTTISSSPYALANGSNTGPRGTFAYTFVYQDSGSTSSPTYTIKATASATGLNGECKIEVLNGVIQTSFTSGSSTAIGTSNTTLASTTMSAAGDNVIVAAVQLSNTAASSVIISANSLAITNGAGTLTSNTYKIDLQGNASGNLSVEGVLLIARDAGASANATYNVVGSASSTGINAQTNILVLNGLDSAYTDGSSTLLSNSSDTTVSSVSTSFAAGENIVIAGNQIDNTTASNTIGVNAGNQKMKSGTTTITSNTFNILLGATNGILESHASGLVYDDTAASATPTYNITGLATTASAIDGQAKLVAFSLASPAYAQATYRLFANNNSTSVGSPLAAQNTAATLTSSGQAFRLRMTINVTNNQLGKSAQAFKLQYVDPGTGTCSSPSGGTPSTYTDVTSSTAIAYNTNSGATDGSALTASGNDPTDGSNTINDETYNDANNFSNDIVWIPKGQDGLWDFSLIDNSGTSGKTYCFRAVASDGTTLSTYTNYPSITTSGSGGGGPSVQADVPWYDYNWQYRRQITIHHSQVSATQTNFPVLISFNSDTDLKNHAQSSGNDILFTASDGQTKLNHEVEHYNSSTGELEAWVNIPSLSSTTDTIIYMYYGNPSASNQQAVTSTWNSNYVSVWHLSQTSLPQNDSTSNAINIINRDSVSTPTLGTATGKIDGADQFSSGVDSAANTNANSALLPSNFTLQAWVNFSSFNTTDDAFIAWKQNSVSPFESYSLEVNTAKNVTCQWKNTSGTAFSAFGNTVLSTGTWYNIACILNGTSLQVYVNGVNDTNGTVTTSGTIFNSDSGMVFGSGNTAESPNAIIDEVRLANTALSSTWLTTEYNNQNSPSTFFTMGSTVQTPIYAPSLDQLMRHGKWFCPSSSINGDTSCTVLHPGKQPFAF